MQKIEDTYLLKFIKQSDFENHVLATVKGYEENLKSINLKRFNLNIIDPIKLNFDKELYNISWEDVIKQEIQRQRDKSNNNAIGYFHQNIFNYIENCEVPKNGFDIVFKGKERTIYVELKNKHNTMNSSSAKSSYIKMQNQILDDSNCECYLVEVIARKSGNIPWAISLNNHHYSHDRIRKVSIDQFYKIVTNDDQSFVNLCEQLPITLRKLIQENKIKTVEKDTVLSELKEIDSDIAIAIYLLAFQNYLGFINYSKALLKQIADYFG